VRDLYETGFDPVLKGPDFVAMQKGTVLEDVRAEQDHIKWADVITFIYPIWWYQMPAMLKGYIDRVFSHGFAYEIGAEGIKGLLSGKKVIMLNTTGGAGEHYGEAGYNVALKRTFDVGTFGLCGMEVVMHKFFYAVPFVKDEDRKKMLEELRGMRLGDILG
jgi:NAD(P)H dehydrogenase (quinone)